MEMEKSRTSFFSFSASAFPFSSSTSSSFSFYIALVSTAFCCLFVFSNLFFNFKNKKNSSNKKRRNSKRKNNHHPLRSSSCKCVCSCGTPNLASSPTPTVKKEQTAMTGASMMEQLVPEITTHTLSYLDYQSLCRLSMTNSLMRKAANDDTAWKALYHKDFTLEQDNVSPPNGWKSYYAATQVVVNLNAQFYNIIRERSLPAMRRFWLDADYVKCVHGTGELFTGYNAVIQSWQMAFDWGQGVAYQIRDVRARVLTDMAWLTMKTYIDMDTGPFHVTNVYEYHNGQWYIVHHHSSVVLIEVELEAQNVFG